MSAIQIACAFLGISVVFVVIVLLVFFWASGEIASIQRRLDSERIGFTPSKNDATGLPVIPQPKPSRAH